MNNGVSEEEVMVKLWAYSIKEFKGKIGGNSIVFCVLFIHKLKIISLSFLPLGKDNIHLN